MGFSIRITAAALLAALVVPAAASAQGSAGRSMSPSLGEQYDALEARLTIGFWTPRLSQYRQEIDGMLSASDLLELNELRARTALLVERVRKLDAMRERAIGSGGDPEGIQGETMIDTTAVYPIDETAVKISEESDRSRYMSIDTGSVRDQGYYERMQEERESEQYRNNVLLLERVLAGDDKALERLEEESSFRESFSAVSSISSIYAEQMNLQAEQDRLESVAKWIARRYPTGMEELRTRFLADLVEYHGRLEELARTFFEKHRAVIVRNHEGEGQTIMEHMIGNLLEGERAKALGESSSAGHVMGEVETALMSYHGEDLKDLLSRHTFPFPDEIVTRLPSSNPLGENSPGRSSRQTVIPYTLPEPSTDVVVRILDARGVLVATFAQGARNAGEQSASIDLATLPPGTYLYQLGFKTPAGEFLYTRSLSTEK